MKRLISVFVLFILIFTCSNSIASSSYDEAYEFAVKDIARHIGAPEISTRDDDLFGQLNSSDFDTSKASLISFFDIDDGSILLFAKMDAKTCKVASWQDLASSVTAEESKLFLEEYEAYQLFCTGKLYVVINQEDNETIVKSAADAEDTIKTFSAINGSKVSSSVPSKLANATYKQGDNNDLVLQIKKRMQELGYFSAGAELSGSYNSTMAERIKLFQSNNGLSQTGNIDAAFLTALYSPLAIRNASSANATANQSTNNTKSSNSSSSQAAKSSSNSSKSSNSGNSGSSGGTYIGNKNTHKFHYSWCSSVKKMKESNKVYLNSRDDAINRGYVPCKNCNP